MFRKKAQAAMEFLMTYGWAILVVLVAIGALAYFGVLSPDKFLPERCTGSSGFDCMDKASIDADGDAVMFVIKNNLGHRLNVTALEEATECEGATLWNASSGAVEVGGTGNALTLKTGETQMFVLNCTGLDEGRFTTRMTIEYLNLETLLPHKAVVSVTGVAT